MSAAPPYGGDTERSSIEQIMGIYLPGEVDDSINEHEFVITSRKSGDQRRASISQAHSSSPVVLKGFGGAFSHPHRQVFYLEEEDIEITFTGYQLDKFRLILYYILSAFTLGIFHILSRSFPRIYIRFVGRECELEKAQWICVENPWGDATLAEVKERYIDATPLSTWMPIEHFDKPGKPVFTLAYFDYRFLRFIYIPKQKQFVQAEHWKDPSWTSVTNIRGGLTRETYETRKLIIGENLMDIPKKSVWTVFVEEVISPFYVFQIFSIALWVYDSFYFYAGTIFAMSASSAITTLLETMSTMKKMRTLSRFECDVRVMRDGTWPPFSWGPGLNADYVSSTDLVPGDVFDLSDGKLDILPCDAVLISGDAIVNESMLTGESLPVSKVPVTDAAIRKIDLAAANIPSDIARHVLFAGTKIVRVRGPEGTGEYGKKSNGGKALAMVIRTGFNTSKGALIRSMLFPKPASFKLYSDSFKFMGIMFFVAIIGFFASVANFIRLGASVKVIIFRSLDVITICIPPALPATMNIGMGFAIGRLKKRGTFCVSPPRINVAGKINCVCYDKTGTLTEEGLEIQGVRVANASTNKFSPEFRSVSQLNTNNPDDTSALMLGVMASCHTINDVNGNLIGDPLDLKMFGFTKWELEESAGSEVVVRPPGEKRGLGWGNESGFEGRGIRVQKVFEFVSSLRRMSVIVKRSNSPTIDVFVKGAPEVMVDICDKNTLPTDYQETLNQLTHRGYRVIACASSTWQDINIQTAQREEIETGLHFLGFIIFENKLKPGTAPVIDTLNQANICQVMCTGDNVLTAVSVARECGIIGQNTEIFLPRFVQGDSMTPNSTIVWQSIVNERHVLNPATLLPHDRPLRGDDPSEIPLQPFPRIGGNYNLAVTGEVFRWMVDYAPVETLNRMLVKAQIFARMSPDEKHELVEKLQVIGYHVAFCGDGANDCGALKAANVGISLSEAEASVAAPFTSRRMDIQCVEDVIKEGRAALVTSFGCFKYMALYSIIEFSAVIMLYVHGGNLGDHQFLFVDLMMVIPMGVLIGRTEAYAKLSPKRPSASLLSKAMLSSFAGQTLIELAFQFFVYFFVQSQQWYTRPVFNPDLGDVLTISFENTVLFLLICYQLIFAALVVAVGPPYRKAWYTNIFFDVITLVLFAISVYLTMAPAQALENILQFQDIPEWYRGMILGLGIAYFGVAWVYEKYAVPALSKLLKKTGTKKHKKVFKNIRGDLGNP